MLIGYNTNVPYKGKIYHVQTEDNGPDRHTIVTLLYHEGAILKSKKTDYSDLIGLPDLEERVRDLMKEQHKDMIKALVRGAFEETQKEDADSSVQHAEKEPAGTAKVEEDVAPKAVKSRGVHARKSLDDILLEHISRKVRD